MNRRARRRLAGAGAWTVVLLCAAPAARGSDPPIVVTVPTQVLADGDRFYGDLTMQGSIAAWRACDLDAERDLAAETCEIWVWDADIDIALPITDDSVHDACPAVAGRSVAFRRDLPAAQQLVIRDLDGAETIVATEASLSCPKLSASRMAWIGDAGAVSVYDRTSPGTDVVGTDVVRIDLSGDFLAWAEGDGELWFTDASDLPGATRMLSDDADANPSVSAVGFSFLPLGTVTTPGVAWTKNTATTAEVLLWRGGTSMGLPIASAPGESVFAARLTSYSAFPSLSLIGPALAWTRFDGSTARVQYCTTCDGDPANVLGLPDHPFFEGAPDTSMGEFAGRWLVFHQFRASGTTDLGLYDLTTRRVTPITADNVDDFDPSLGWRASTPAGPVVVWLSDGGAGGMQVSAAPEPTAGLALAACAALAGLRRLRRKTRIRVTSRGGPDRAPRGVRRRSGVRAGARVVAVVTLASAPAQLAAAENLVPDGSFDEPSLAAWAIVVFDGSTVAWAPLDASGSPSSGSVRFEEDGDTGPANSARLRVALPLEVGTPYRLSFRYLLPAQERIGRATLDARWQTSYVEDEILGSGCSGFLFHTDTFDSPPFVVHDVWHDVELPDFVAPGGCLELTIGVASSEQGPGRDTIVFFDDVRVVPEPDGAGAGAMALLAAAGIRISASQGRDGRKRAR